MPDQPSQRSLPVCGHSEIKSVLAMAKIAGRRTEDEVRATSRRAAPEGDPPWFVDHQGFRPVRAAAQMCLVKATGSTG